MKRFFTLSFFFTIAMGLQAQSGYSVEIFTEAYTDLVGATEISDPSDIWDDPELNLPLGFTANINGETTDSLFSNDATGGVLYTASDYDYYVNSAVFFFYGADLRDRAAGNQPYSPISIQTTGNAGEKIFKFEYKNAGFFSEISSTYDAPSFVNVQFWLYESDNSWESRIGESNIVDTLVSFDDYEGPYIGYGLLEEGDFTKLALLNSSNDPITLDTFDLSMYNDFFGVQPPAENTVIRFYEPTVGTKSPSEITGLKLFPNLTSDVVNLEISNSAINKSGAAVTIYDINGSSYFRTKVQSNGTLQIPVAHLAAGQYYLSVQGEEGFKTLPFAKQ